MAAEDHFEKMIVPSARRSTAWRACNIAPIRTAMSWLMESSLPEIWLAMRWSEQERGRCLTLNRDLNVTPLSARP
jgi:hypothetical protein